MKNLLLTICFVFINTLSSQNIAKEITGTWQSEKTDYTLVVSKHEKSNKFKFLNYKTILLKDEEGCLYDEFIYSPEEFVKVKNNKIYTFVSWNDLGSFHADLVYELINKNEIKVTFTGSANTTLYYERIK